MPPSSRGFFSAVAPRMGIREIWAAELVDLFRTPCCGIRGRPLFAGPSRDVELVLGIPPSIEEQRLYSPFVGEIFQEIADEGDRPVLRYNRSLRMPGLEVVGERGGFSTKCAVWVLQDWNKVETQMLGLPPKGLGHDDPIEGYPSIPHQGAELDGVGRGCRPNELVARFHLFALPIEIS